MLTHRAPSATRLHQRRSTGFTLIELLVVIAVIGILTAILVPTIRGIFVRMDDFARETEMDQFDLAIEKFKTEYGFIPPDFSLITGPVDMQFYLSKISSNHQENTVDPIDGTDTRLQVWWDRVGSVLATYPYETSLWFWLSQLRDNSQFPLTGSRNPGDLTLVTDESKVFFEFDQTRLHVIPNIIADPTGNTPAVVDYPQGAAVGYSLYHYEQAGGGEAPYIYYHNRSFGTVASCYEVMDDGDSLGFVASYRLPDGVNPPPGSPAGCDCLWEFYEVDKYQIICAGDDGVFGDIDDPNEDAAIDFLDDNPIVAERLYGRNIQFRSQGDNMTNFSQGRIETMDIYSGL